MDFEIGFIHDAMLASTTATPTSSSAATTPLEEAWNLPRCDVPGWEIKWMLLNTIEEKNRIYVQVIKNFPFPFNTSVYSKFNLTYFYKYQILRFLGHMRG